MTISFHVVGLYFRYRAGRIAFYNLDNIQMVAEDILNITTDMDNSAWLLKYVFHLSMLLKIYTSVFNLRKAME